MWKYCSCAASTIIYVHHNGIAKLSEQSALFVSKKWYRFEDNISLIMENSS